MELSFILKSNLAHFTKTNKYCLKKLIVSLLVCAMTINLTGCGLIPSLDLTESQQKIIAEYAAGLLLKYDKNYNGSLKQLEDDSDKLDVVQEEVSEPPATIESTDPTVGDIEGPEFSEELMAEEQMPESEVQYSDISIASAIGLEDFDIIYKSYETHKIYPEDEADDLVFSLQAQNGMELIVLNFGITNNTDHRSRCDVLGSDASFRLLINGTERVNGYKTILLNDLSSFSDEIEGFGMANAVLVFEVSEGTADGIQEMDLIVKKDSGSTTHKLH